MHHLNLSDFIKYRADILNINMSELAKKTHMSRQTLYNLLSGSTEQAKISTLVALAEALETDPGDLFYLILRQTNGLKVATSSTLTRRSSDGYRFVGDVTIADNTKVLTNQVFTKIWGIKNTSQSHWLGRKLKCMNVAVEMPQLEPDATQPTIRSGLIPAQRVIDIPDTEPGKSVTLQMEFTAPCYPCSVMSYWCMTDQRNEICYPESEGLSCVVQVIDINAF